MIDHIFFEALYEDNECGQIAAVRTNRKGEHVEAFEEQIKTKTMEGVSLEETMTRLKKQLLNEKYAEDYVVICLSPPKDINVFKKTLTKSWMSLKHLAWPLSYSGMIRELSLDSISKHHGIVNKRPTEATGNVVAILETYWQMMRRYKTALVAEDRLREIGGQSFESLRRGLGF